MHCAAVVPDHQVAIAPDVPVLEPGLERMFVQRIQQNVAFLIIPTIYMADSIGIYV